MGLSRRPFDVVTFDCYGTLIDWERGIAEAFAREAEEDGVILDRARLLDVYARIEPLLQAGAFRPYREVLGQAARAVARELGWSLDTGRAAFLARSLPEWPVFPDTNPALERLSAAGYGLGILSNVDDDLLDGTLRHLSARFELRVTAQQVRSYKPAPEHFAVAAERIGGAAWLHAAQSYFHDVVPAREQELRVAWINRKREAAGAVRPDYTFHDLTGLAGLLAGPRPRSVTDPGSGSTG